MPTTTKDLAQTKNLAHEVTLRVGEIIGKFEKAKTRQAKK